MKKLYEDWNKATDSWDLIESIREDPEAYEDETDLDLPYRVIDTVPDEDGNVWRIKEACTN